MKAICSARLASLIHLQKAQSHSEQPKERIQRGKDRLTKPRAAAGLGYWILSSNLSSYSQ